MNEGLHLFCIHISMRMDFFSSCKIKCAELFLYTLPSSSVLTHRIISNVNNFFKEKEEQIESTNEAPIDWEIDLPTSFFPDTTGISIQEKHETKEIEIESYDNLTTNPTESSSLQKHETGDFGISSENFLTTNAAEISTSKKYETEDFEMDSINIDEYLDIEKQNESSNESFNENANGNELQLGQIHDNESSKTEYTTSQLTEDDIDENSSGDYDSYERNSGDYDYDGSSSGYFDDDYYDL